MLVFLVSLFLFFILTPFFLSYFRSAPLSVKPGGPSMTSRPIRQPSPPPVEDTRIPSPARATSPPAPHMSPPRHDAPDTRVSEISTEPVAPPLNPSISTEPLSTSVAPTVTPAAAVVDNTPAPSAPVLPPASKGTVPTAEVSASVGASTIRKAAPTKTSTSQKGLAGSSQPSIADVLCKGTAPTKASVTSAANTQLALHTSPAAAVVTQHVRGKVLTRTASGNSLGSLVEYAHNWNAADQLEGNRNSQPFQLSDISSRLDQAAKIILDSNKMNEVIATSRGLD